MQAQARDCSAFELVWVLCKQRKWFYSFVPLCLFLNTACTTAPIKWAEKGARVGSLPVPPGGSVEVTRQMAVDGVVSHIAALEGPETPGKPVVIGKLGVPDGNREAAPGPEEAPDAPWPDETLKPEGNTRIEPEDAPQIPIVLNKRVRWFIDHYTGPGRVSFAKWLERSTGYIEMMRPILQEEGVPEDLIYIALIESGFDPEAYSWAGASGVWQFMRPTAQRYGLKVNWWIDERRDPVKSTRAAARYFKDLYETFRSWYLAQAGYNAGEGRIQRGLRQVERKDFWTLAKTRYVPLETRNFVPKFVAASILAKNPEAYGFTGLNYAPPLRFEEVPARRSTDLRWIARAAGVSLEEIRRLNPELRRWWTPPNYPDYKLKVPPGTREKIARAIADWNPRLLAHRTYIVQPGDTLGAIARHLGTSVEVLAQFNRLVHPGRIYAGQRLLLFKGVGPGEAEPDSLAKEADGTDAAEDLTVHVVWPGDTIWEMSRRYDAPMGDLMAWNRPSEDARPRPGGKV